MPKTKEIVADSKKAGLPILAQMYRKMESIPRKLRRKRGFWNLKSHISGPISLEVIHNPASVATGTWCHPGENSTHQSDFGVNTLSPFPHRNGPSFTVEKFPRNSNGFLPGSSFSHPPSSRAGPFIFFDPLRSHPPQVGAIIRDPDPRRCVRVPRLRNNRHSRRFLDVSILPPLEEASEGDEQQLYELPSGRFGERRY